LKSKAFLHFHEDPAGVFADVRVGDDFHRLPANTTAEWKVVLATVASAFRDPSQPFEIRTETVRR
jgi:hypothetical protein